jgi:hypothetical protein
MPLVEAWQCPHTGTLFAKADRHLYQAHLRRIATVRRRERATQRALAERDQYLANTLWNLSTIAEIEQWFLNNGAWLSSVAFKDYPRARVVNFTRFSLDVRWYKHVSNTHSAPRGQPTNWGRESGTPTGYPGYRGTVSFDLDRECPGFTSDLFRATGLDTGTGSGGRLNCQYEAILWDADWPGLKTMRVLTA